MRNPWGSTDYNGTWNKDDPNWNEVTVKQVKHGFDPRTSWKEGIFVVPIEAFKIDNCFYSYQIGHYRNKEGYDNTWTDSYNFPENSWQDFIFTPSQRNGDIYFQVDTYSYNIVPKVKECMTEAPILYYRVFHVYKSSFTDRPI